MATLLSAILDQSQSDRLTCLSAAKIDFSLPFEFNCIVTSNGFTCKNAISYHIDIMNKYYDCSILAMKNSSAAGLSLARYQQ